MQGPLAETRERDSQLLGGTRPQQPTGGLEFKGQLDFNPSFRGSQEILERSNSLKDLEEALPFAPEKSDKEEPLFDERIAEQVRRTADPDSWRESDSSWE